MQRRIAVVALALASCHASRLRRYGREEAEGDTRSVRLIIARHGFSCSNVIKEFAAYKSDIAKVPLFPDPPLSDCGVVRSKNAAQLMADEKVDFVGSSELFRAIETAWHEFGKKEVHVLPYIGEWFPGAAGGLMDGLRFVGYNFPELTAMPRDKQERLLKQYSDDSLVVNYTWAESTPTRPSWTNFVSFLGKRLLPNLGVDAEGDVYTLGVASHGLMILDSIGGKPKAKHSRKNTSYRSLCYEALLHGHPNNNVALEMFFDYNIKTKSLDVNTEKGCRALGSTSDMPAGVPAAPTTICERDFARCIDPFWEHRNKKRPFPTVGKTTAHDRYGYPKIKSVEQALVDEKPTNSLEQAIEEASGECQCV